MQAGNLLPWTLSKSTAYVIKGCSGESTQPQGEGSLSLHRKEMSSPIINVAAWDC